MSHNLNKKSLDYIEEKTGLNIKILRELNELNLSFCVMNQKDVEVFLDKKNEIKIKYRGIIFNQSELTKYLYDINYSPNVKNWGLLTHSF